MNSPMLSPKVYQTAISMAIQTEVLRKKYRGEGKKELNIYGNPQKVKYNFD